MNKNEENKLSDAIITLHQEIKGMRGDMEKHQTKMNLALGEMRLSYMKLDENFNAMRQDINVMRHDLNKYAKEFSQYAQSNNALLKNHEARLVRLEEKDGKGRGTANMVSEPRAAYKKTKRKK